MTPCPKRVAHRQQVRVALQLVEGKIARGPSGKALLWQVSEASLRDSNWFDKTFKSGLTAGRIRKLLPLFDKISEEIGGRAGNKEIEFFADVLSGEQRKAPASIAHLPSVQELIEMGQVRMASSMSVNDEFSRSRRW